VSRGGSSALVLFAAMVLTLFGQVALASSAATQRYPAVSDDNSESLVWSRLPPDRPLFGQTAVVDREGGRMVLIGGELDVNEPPTEFRQLRFSSLKWSPYDAGGEPPASRHGGILRGASLVLDEAERVALLSCDCENGGTHLLDLETDTWSRAPNDHERSLSGALLAYDPVGDVAILYGGLERGLPPILDEGMAYDLSDQRSGWRDLPAAPFRLTGQAVSYAPDARHVIAFGGQLPDGRASDELWILEVERMDEPDAWRQLVPGDGTDWPAARMGATLTMDPTTATAVLFGGYSVDGDLADQWLLDYSDPAAPQWHPLSIEDGPRPRAGHSAAWDGAARRVVVFGGVSSDGGIKVLDDTWALAASVQVRSRLFVPAATCGSD